MTLGDSPWKRPLGAESKASSFCSAGDLVLSFNSGFELGGVEGLISEGLSKISSAMDVSGFDFPQSFLAPKRLFVGAGSRVVSGSSISSDGSSVSSDSGSSEDSGEGMVSIFCS